MSSFETMECICYKGFHISIIRYCDCEKFFYEYKDNENKTRCSLHLDMTWCTVSEANISGRKSVDTYLYPERKDQFLM